jgi:hypothetical protein
LRSQMREAVREVNHWGAMLDEQPAAEEVHPEARSASPRAA